MAELKHTEDSSASGICKNCNNHIREKLVELFDEAARICNNQDCRACGYFREANCINKTIIDHLIAHGVTVQKWIPVSERMPEENTRVLVWLAPKHYEYTNVDTDRLYRGKWVRWNSRVTHWMPLPQPPKGE